MHVAILISSNFSKFYIKSFKTEAPKHTKYKVTRHCRTALRRQFKNLSPSSGIHIPSHSCILTSQIVRAQVQICTDYFNSLQRLIPTSISHQGQSHGSYPCCIPYSSSGNFSLPPRPQKHLLCLSTSCLN